MTRGKLGGRGADAATLKVAREAHEIAKAIVQHLSLHGWKSVGVERTDPPTVQGVIEEGIKLLAARAQGRRKGT